MNSRQRLQATLDHKQPDRVVVDIGSTTVTGISASTLYRLRQAVMGDNSPVTIPEPYQMLGEVTDDIREALDIDVVGLAGRGTYFAFLKENWKPFTLFDGTPVMVPGGFTVTTDPATGDLLIYPEGDLTAPASGRMPKGGFYFDAIIRQQPFDEDKLDPADNVEQFKVYNADDERFFTQRSHELAAKNAGIVTAVAGSGFGDIAHIPGTMLKHPKGIRDVEEWYVSLMVRPDFVRKVFEGMCEVALKNIEILARCVGDRADVAYVSGADFGAQRGLFISLDLYRELFKPFHKIVNDRIHKLTKWKTFVHSCGGIIELIPDLIEAGWDILNPVQCSAAGMDPRTLKKEFGRQITFWGGGVDTQKTLPFGTPDEVYREVRERIDIFNDGGGFVFNAIHNIQAQTPVPNLLAMFKAIKDSCS